MSELDYARAINEKLISSLQLYESGYKDKAIALLWALSDRLPEPLSVHDKTEHDKAEVISIVERKVARIDCPKG